jgi:predicted membrane channel-forming protein YqfA (hemolysin III family)
MQTTSNPRKRKFRRVYHADTFSLLSGSLTPELLRLHYCLLRDLMASTQSHPMHPVEVVREGYARLWNE